MAIACQSRGVYRIEITKLEAWSTQVLSDLNPVDTGWSEINYDPVYPKRLANPIIILPIGDKPGPLGKVRCAVLVQTLCLRTAIYCHADSTCHVRLRNLESWTKHSEYFSGIKNHCLDAGYHGNGIYRNLSIVRRSHIICDINWVKMVLIWKSCSCCT